MRSKNGLKRNMTLFDRDMNTSAVLVFLLLLRRSLLDVWRKRSAIQCLTTAFRLQSGTHLSSFKQTFYDTIDEVIASADGYWLHIFQSTYPVTERMSDVIKNFLASLGFGAAQIDLILDRDCLTMGETVTGKLVLIGGAVKQIMEGLKVHFCLASAYPKDDHHVDVNEIVATIPVFEENFIIEPGETKEYLFQFVCPRHLPVSSVNTRFFFKTDLEIKSGIDAEDRDMVDVYASGIQRHFLEGFARLGFRHHNEAYTGKGEDGYQIIYLRPTSWLFGKIEGIEIKYQPANVDQWVSGFFKLGEQKGRFHFSAEELGNTELATETIRQFILRKLNHH
jgi:sporulation-control protein